jgi:hypothetical protein
MVAGAGHYAAPRRNLLTAGNKHVAGHATATHAKRIAALCEMMSRRFLVMRRALETLSASASALLSEIFRAIENAAGISGGIAMIRPVSEPGFLHRIPGHRRVAT